MAEIGPDQQWEVYFRGRVQGVGFRYTTCRIASHFAVAGYVRNLPDGRVHLVAEGAPEELGRFLEAVQAYLGSHIRDTVKTVAPASGGYTGFVIRY